LASLSPYKVFECGSRPPSTSIANIMVTCSTRVMASQFQFRVPIWVDYWHGELCRESAHSCGRRERIE